MVRHLDEFDTSNYPTDHPLYSKGNAKVFGKFKDETASVPPIESVGLRSKMYSLLVKHDEPAKFTAKGVKRTWVENNLRHDTFKEVLFKKSVTFADFRKSTSTNHAIHTSILHKNVSMRLTTNATC